MKLIQFPNSDAPQDLDSSGGLDPQKWKQSVIETDFVPIVSLPENIIGRNKEITMQLALEKFPTLGIMAEAMLRTDLYDRLAEKARTIDLVRTMHSDEAKSRKKVEKFGNTFVSSDGRIKQSDLGEMRKKRLTQEKRLKLKSKLETRSEVAVDESAP